MKTRISIILIRSFIILGVTVGGLMLLSAVKTKDAKPCSGIEVHFHNGTASGFVPESDVLATIKEIMLTEPVGSPLENFDLKRIEIELENNPWVYDAQLYFDNTQSLHVMLDEAVPVARGIDTRGKQFYLDQSGKALPLSSTYRADLPVFTGLPVMPVNTGSVQVINRVCSLAVAIKADSFWLAQAAQIDLAANGSMVMVPVIGNHIVDLGFAADPESMLLKLKCFYKAMAASGRLDNYERINASYAGQIVAQKAHYVVANEDGNMAMNTYQKLVIENKKEVDANSIVTQAGVGRFVNELPEPKPEISKKSGKEEPPSLKEKSDQDKAIPNMKPFVKPAEKKTENKEEKIPKAIMPKLENN